MKRLGVIVILAAILAFTLIIYSSRNNVDLENQPSNKQMKITSSAFNEGQRIPLKYTCDGDNINPPLSWTDVPEAATSLVLVMDDPDIPDFVKEQRGIEVFDHWTAYSIPASSSGIEEGKEIGSAGMNSAGRPGYTGPCPPDREHRYFFKLYALQGQVNFIQAPTKDQLLEAIKPMIIAEASLMGTYERVSQD